MPLPIDFTQLTLWLCYTFLASLLTTILAFLFNWGFRFRFVGITGFLIVLVIGSFGLSLGLLPRTEIAGAIRYNVVYDNGSNQVVIVLNPKPTQSITPKSVEATLQQAAANQFTSGRFSSNGNEVLTIRARTILHEAEGISRPLFVGQVQRSLSALNEPTLNIQVDPKAIARITA